MGAKDGKSDEESSDTGSACGRGGRNSAPGRRPRSFSRSGTRLPSEKGTCKSSGRETSDVTPSGAVDEGTSRGTSSSASVGDDAPVNAGSREDGAWPCTDDENDDVMTSADCESPFARQTSTPCEGIPQPFGDNSLGATAGPSLHRGQPHEDAYQWKSAAGSARALKFMSWPGGSQDHMPQQQQQQQLTEELPHLLPMRCSRQGSQQWSQAEHTEAYVYKEKTKMEPESKQASYQQPMQLPSHQSSQQSLQPQQSAGQQQQQLQQPSMMAQRFSQATMLQIQQQLQALQQQPTSQQMITHMSQQPPMSPQFMPQQCMSQPSQQQCMSHQIAQPMQEQQSPQRSQQQQQQPQQLGAQLQQQHSHQQPHYTRQDSQQFQQLWDTQQQHQRRQQMMHQQSVDPQPMHQQAVSSQMHSQMIPQPFGNQPLQQRSHHSESRQHQQPRQSLPQQLLQHQRERLQQQEQQRQQQQQQQPLLTQPMHPDMIQDWSQTQPAARNPQGIRQPDQQQQRQQQLPNMPRDLRDCLFEYSPSQSRMNVLNEETQPCASNMQNFWQQQQQHSLSPQAHRRSQQDALPMRFAHQQDDFSSQTSGDASPMPAGYNPGFDADRPCVENRERVFLQLSQLTEASSRALEVSQARPEHGQVSFSSDGWPKKLLSDGVTTVMIRNLPDTLTQASLMAAMDTTGFRDQYDFAYLPCSFTSQEAKGFAFVNFQSSTIAQEFAFSWHGTRRFGLDSKALNISEAAVQGKDANVARWGTCRKQRIRNPARRPFVKAEPAERGSS
eukprot:TRINITY_DN589_c2_g1_i1.p1 TRINITY_DN589_c2_g1~~TRINITY_DN589_c2_g1_i1.p1  ORF type:complete len:906 (+),score=181.80 TRINITY_DN589_c2_g1_i1:381-2720(+)